MITHRSLRHLSRRLAKHVVARLDRNLATLMHLGFKAKANQVRQATGQENEDFRDDLMMYILDYNRVADQNIDLLVDLAGDNGHPLPTGLDADLLRNYFRQACEAAAVNLMNQPKNNPDMFNDIEHVILTAMPEHPIPEATAARLLLRTLLGGYTPSEANAA